MRTIKITEKFENFFVDMYFNDNVLCVARTENRPEIKVNKNKNLKYKGYININGVCLYFDKLELDTKAGNVIVE